MNRPALVSSLCVLLLPLTLSATGCGEDRRLATDPEKEVVQSLLSTGFQLRNTKGSERITLPPGTETLLELVIDSLCAASVSTTSVGDHTKETLTFDCKDGDFKGTYSRELDHYAFDLSAKTSLDIRYTGDVTARKDFVDGFVELKAIKDLWITDVGVSDRIDFQGVTLDKNGCLIGGGMRMELHANIPGKRVDASTDAIFGPTCGEVWVRD